LKQRWMDVAPDALEKRERNFEAWISGRNIAFESEEAEMVYKERACLIRDAAFMKIPRRVPVCPAAGHFPIKYSGISWYEAMYDYEKIAHAWEKYHVDFPRTASAAQGRLSRRRFSISWIYAYTNGPVTDLPMIRNTSLLKASI